MTVEFSGEELAALTKIKRDFEKGQRNEWNIEHSSWEPTEASCFALQSQVKETRNILVATILSHTPNIAHTINITTIYDSGELNCCLQNSGSAIGVINIFYNKTVVDSLENMRVTHNIATIYPDGGFYINKAESHLTETGLISQSKVHQVSSYGYLATDTTTEAVADLIAKMNSLIKEMSPLKKNPYDAGPEDGAIY